LPQDGRTTVSHGNREIDIRVSTQPTIDGERIVLRLLDRHGTLLDLNSLGLSGKNLKKIGQMIGKNGLLLITGPTGSGKTTTMYAILNNLRSGYRNIMTVEDPVEYVMEGISQTQVNIRAGLDFAVGLRAVLRQDPDIITADLAVRAAGTGHLVFSTLHTGDAAGALTRLLEMGVEPYRVASSLLGAVAQRLCRVTCDYCDGTGHGRLESAHSNVCGKCGGSGFRGQTGIHEVLVVEDDLRELLVKGSSSRTIREVAVRRGMETLLEDGMEKAARGIVSTEEIKRVTGNA
jgi:type II secretory ATPase GspE/PulE/Tfp pilus assembly ATPase PilB-like protein